MLPAKPDAPTRFRPLALLTNPHLQTAVGFLWRGRRFRQPTRQAQVLLPDGDRLVLHDSVPAEWADGQPAALLIHGLGGSSNSSYIQRVSGRLFRRGVRVVRVDLRGTGAGFGLAEKFYHGGRSDDIRAALAEIHRWAPTSPLLLAGFSLGGNIALKLAGEAADEPIANLNRVVAVAPPIDVVRCSELISLPHNRFYDRFFARQLVRLARLRQTQYPDPPLPEFPRKLSIRDFDNLFTAPHCGFADAQDYYRRASSLPYIAKILVPTLIVTARDDPFIDVAPFEELSPPPHVQVEIHDHGGHLGFLGPDGEGGVRWVERRIVEWLVG